MKDKQWVCHISGQGEKWEVHEEYDDSWSVNKQSVSRSARHWLPKSEYILCEPLERWVDVTKDVRERHAYSTKSDPNPNAGDFVTHEITDLAKLTCGGKYRLTKVRAIIEGRHAGTYCPAFIVEKREP